jgi:two-component system NarL family response regulator
MSGAPCIRVMVVDDHALVRDGVTAILSLRPEFDVVAEAGTGAEAVSMFRARRPDVTLMDLRLPDMGGADVVARLRAEDPAARFIVLTTFDGDEDVYRAVRAGARGYLLKGMRGDDLAQAIRAVAAGEQWFPAEIALRAMRREVGPALTERERGILQLIVDGRSNKEIAGALGVTEPTVKGHLRRLFDKLGVTTRTQAALEAIKRGLATVR